MNICAFVDVIIKFISVSFNIYLLNILGPVSLEYDSEGIGWGGIYTRFCWKASDKKEFGRSTSGLKYLIFWGV